MGIQHIVMSIEATVQIQRISFRLCLSFTLSIVSIVSISVWVSSISVMSIETTVQIQRISFRLGFCFTLSIVSIVSMGVWVSSISVMSIESTMQIQGISFRLCLSLGLRLSKSQSSQTNNEKSLHSLDVSPTSDQ